MSGFTEAFARLSNKLQNLEQQALVTMQVMSERHYRDSFRDGGFTDQSFQRWQPLAKRKGTPLVKTGQLRGSIRSQIIGKSVKVFSDRGYASYHNEGTQNIPKREFIGLSHKLNNNIRNQIIMLARKVFY